MGVFFFQPVLTMTTMTDTLADKFDEIVGQDPTDDCYSQEELDQLLRDKENEVKEQFLQEERDIRKDIAEIRSKFDESVNRDRRQQEVIDIFEELLRSYTHITHSHVFKPDVLRWLVKKSLPYTYS